MKTGEDKMKFCMEFGDTNFIGLVNAWQYKSFVDEDWELDGLLQHFSPEMKKRDDFGVSDD
ncbi:hypothetical protein [Domibacillus tundrae]|uniref:hypothetical protein n=1 Tax=Domibacillus tundrae TaxID=1587527 RepID=UPI001FDFD610|nr:hypothetical protein [Domibacillus tundrae]